MRGFATVVPAAMTARAANIHPVRMLASLSVRLRLGRPEDEGEAVHAVTQAGRPRPVVEDVSEMAAAAPAEHFGAAHSEAGVGAGQHGVGEGAEEARPAGAALELCVGGEQRQSAAGAGEDALAVLVEKRARA